MKRICLLLMVLFAFAGCKSTTYQSQYNQLNQTQVVLSGANFNVLGSFTGTATDTKMKVTVRDVEGLLSKAKANLLAKARVAGVELKGSRALVNVTTDLVENEKMVTLTISADIIEFVE